MTRVHQIEIRCRHCRNWFPSPVVFGDDESFDTATLTADTVTCSHCGRETGCDPQNVRVRSEESEGGRDERP
jgi:hypothetical protein